MNANRQWLKRFLCLFLLCSLLVVAVNLVIDPYGIYRLVLIEGINTNKHIAIKHTRIIKPYLVGKLQPRTLITGSSRSEVALDPDHADWPANNAPVFNYSFPGTTIQELSYWLGHAFEVAPVKKLVFGLDFHLFAGTAPYQSEWKGVGDVYLKTLFSLDSLEASRKTIKNQDVIEDPGLLANGQVAWTVNQRRVHKYGHRHDFRANEESLKKPLEQRDKSLPYVTDHALKTFEQLLYDLRDHDVEAAFFIFPVHIRWLEVFYQTSHWDEFLEWERQLVEIIDRNNREFPDRQPYRLTDFTGVNMVTTEPVPPLGDVETEMKYYWETSHTKKSAGDLILSRLMSDAEVFKGDKRFGVTVDSNNIDEWLVEKTRTFLQYRDAHPDMIEEIRKM